MKTAENADDSKRFTKRLIRSRKCDSQHLWRPLRS